MLNGNVPFKGNNIKDLHQMIINGSYNNIKDISNEAKDLICKIFEVDPLKRISIDEILNHPWMNFNDGYEDNKNRLFTKAEIVLLSKENVDYRNCGKSDLIENFTIKNLYTINDKENQNITSKSEILAPFNSSYIEENNNNINNKNNNYNKNNNNNNNRLNNYDNKLEKSLEICNEVIQFNENSKVLNRLYELNNNGEIDHGVLINPNSTKQEYEENINEVNEIDEDLIDDNNKKITPNLNINQQNDNSSKQNSKRNDSNLTNSSTLIIDESILKSMENLGYKKDYIQKILSANEFNYASATYFLLSNQTDIINETDKL